jgi:hypothetical protein
MANTTNQNKRKFHTIYQTTNLVNNKIYIGAHSTDNINDNYCGSGTNISRAIEKYGREFFKKDILYIFETPEKMFDKEKEIVTPEFLKRQDVYNIVEGGYGGFNKGTTGLKHLHHSESGKRCAVHPNAVSKMLQEGWILGRNISSTINTVWIHNKTDKKMIPLENLPLYITNGWTKGLPKSPTNNKIWIFNNQTNEYSLCDKSDLDKKLLQGWVRKKWAPVKKGACWINNGKDNLRIEKALLDNYLKQGWDTGMVIKRKL